MQGSTLSYKATWTTPYRFMFATDAHVGWEVTAAGKKVPVHNEAAITSMLKFASDFRPHGFIAGGDWLDLGAISHHNKSKKRAIENLRVDEDVKWMGKNLMAPVEEVTSGELWYIGGNHERFLEDLIEGEPGLADTLTIPKLANLEQRGWEWIPVGGRVDIGKLRFIHGDQLSGGGMNIAKRAIETHFKSIAFGHFHTKQEYVTHSPVDATSIHVGIAVPALANRAPAYGRNRPNKWANGFLYGVSFPDGTFAYHNVVMTDGRFYANGKIYKG